MESGSTRTMGGRDHGPCTEVVIAGYVCPGARVWPAPDGSVSGAWPSQNASPNSCAPGGQRQSPPVPSNLSRFRVCREANAAGKFFQRQETYESDRDNSLSPCRRGSGSRAEQIRSPHQKENKMSQDRQLQESVMEELGWEPSIDAAHIGVAANAGVVTLTGYNPKLRTKGRGGEGSGSGERREGRS